MPGGVRRMCRAAYDIFSPTTAVMSNVMKKMRARVAGSCRKRMPTTTVPTAPDACPDGIGRADGDALRRFGQQHAERQAQQEAGAPEVIGQPVGVFHLPEAKGEARFKEAGHDECDPVHDVRNFRGATGKPPPPLPLFVCSLSPQAAFRSLITASLSSSAHPIRASMCGSSERARPGGAYSALGGTSGHTVRVAQPSSSSVLRRGRRHFLRQVGGRTAQLLEAYCPPGGAALSSVYTTRSDRLSQSLAWMFRIGPSGDTASSIVVLSIDMMHSIFALQR